MRRLQDRLAFRPLEGRFKLALILTAHAMNQNAQNALLKTLEEPPRDTVLVLVSSSPDKLLPTIRSRCAKANFGPLPAPFIAATLQKLKKLDELQAQQVATMAGGSLARALEFDVKTLGRRRELIERFEALSATDARGWLQLAEVMGEDRPTAEASLEVLQVWLRDIAVAQAGGLSFVNTDLAELAARRRGSGQPSCAASAQPAHRTRLATPSASATARPGCSSSDCSSRPSPRERAPGACFSGRVEDRAHCRSCTSYRGCPSGFSPKGLKLALTGLGLSMTSISLAGALSLPWSLKPLIAPFVDGHGHAGFGRRRSWIVPLQAALGLTCLAAAYCPPGRTGWARCWSPCC